MTTRINLLEAHLDKLDYLISKHEVPQEFSEWAAEARTVLDAHGTRSSYTRGCRCDDCRKAEASYQRGRRKSCRDGFAQSVLEDAL